MGAVVSFAFAALFISASDVTAHLEAPPKLFEPIKAGIVRERPGLRFAEDGVLRFVVRSTAAGFLLVVEEAGRVLETRELGKAPDAAIRLAVLLSLRRIEEREQATSAALEPSVTATIAEVDELDEVALPEPRRPVRAMIETSTPAIDAAGWELEASVLLIGWTAPFTLRPGVGAAALRRYGSFAFGARAVASGWCCTIAGEGVDLDPSFAALYAEARARTGLGPIGLETQAALGPTYDSIGARARAPETFAALGAGERIGAFTVGARAGLSADVAIFGSFYLAASAGISWFAQDISVALPEPYAQRRPPSRRGRVLPGFELSLRAVDF